MPWYKDRISSLVVDCESTSPYSFWCPYLFSEIHPKFVPSEIGRVLNDVAVTMGTWERVIQTAQLWGDDHVLNAVNHGYLLTGMFMCLAYPRETVMRQLADGLPADTNEGRLCRALADKNSPFRHIRNSIAHGDFELTSDGRAVAFSDREWKDTRPIRQVELDSLLVFDVLMSAFERTLRTGEWRGSPPT